MKQLISLLLLTCFANSCAQKKTTIEFAFNKLHNPASLATKKDSAIAFINYILQKDFKRAQNIYPGMFKIDPSAGMIQVKDEKPFLNGLGEYVNGYSNNSYDLLALTVYLRSRYDTRLELYDKMLRGSIRLDSTNIDALYLLAELRYKNEVKADAAYLTLKMKEAGKNNPEINRLFILSEPEIKKLDKNLPSLSDFFQNRCILF